MSDGASPAVLVVGGGPAGMTTALYTTRLGHETLVCEESGGRHAAVSHVHNLYGVSEDVSGRELSAHAVAQLREYGGSYRETAVTGVHESEDGSARFRVETEDGDTVHAARVVFATGFRDRGPAVPDLTRFTGRGLHYCLHCDAYALGGASTFVLGHDDHAAEVAMLLLNVTAEVDLLLDGRAPKWSESVAQQLAAHPVECVETEVTGAVSRAERDGEPEEREAEPWLGGLQFADGSERAYRGGFAMYGTDYETDLAAELGCKLADDGALVVDGDRETSVDGAYGVGDVTHGQNQTTIAMADGAHAGIAIHKDLREFPRDVAPGATVDEHEVPAVSANLLDRMNRVREQDCHAGLSDPPPGE